VAIRGEKLRAAAANKWMTFEVDSLDAEGKSGWSVLVVGTAEESKVASSTERKRRLCVRVRPETGNTPSASASIRSAAGASVRTAHEPGSSAAGPSARLCPTVAIDVAFSTVRRRPLHEGPADDSALKIRMAPTSRREYVRSTIRAEVHDLVREVDGSRCHADIFPRRTATTTEPLAPARALLESRG
jgi:hypothetical protein